jgi:predicted alpha/beta superfamily hydrolase
MKFVVDSLKPLIDEHYRTKPSREHTYTAGSSAGGLCAFILVWEHSEVFSKAICMSPAFKLARPDESLRLDYVAVVAATERPKDPVFIYLDNGGVGLEKNLQPGIDAMLEAMKNQGLQAGRDYHWVHAPEESHTEAAWAKRFPAAIQMLSADD